MSEGYLEVPIATTERKNRIPAFSTAMATALVAASAGANPMMLSDLELGLFLSSNDSDLNYKDVVVDNGRYSFKSAQAELSQSSGERTAMTAISISDMVTEIKSLFGLNNVQVAQVIGVSRPTLYNHLSGKETPLSLERYERMYEVARLVRSNIQVDIKRGLKSVLVEGRTLLSYLKEDHLDPDSILTVASLIARKLSEDGNFDEKYSTSFQIKASREIAKPG